jgi:hypothetical protein
LIVLCYYSLLIFFLYLLLLCLKLGKSLWAYLKLYNSLLVLFFFLCTGALTQSLMHARQAFYHWATSSDIFKFYLRQGFTTLLRLASNLWSSCLSLPSDGIIGMLLGRKQVSDVWDDAESLFLPFYLLLII